MPNAQIIAKNVGDFLSAARRRMNLTQTDVAHLLGMATSYPSHDEVGITKVPPTRLKQLAQIYQLSEREQSDLLDLASEQQYKRLDISTLDKGSRRRVLGAIYAES